MVVNVTKTSQEMKKINWLSIETNITKWEKILCYNYKKYFSVEKKNFIKRSIKNF